MRRGVQPRDHARENRMAIREQQLRNRERKHEEVAQAQQPFKMQQFRNIQSKLKSDTEDRVEKSKLRLDMARMKENVTRPSNSPEAKRNSPVDGSKPRQFLKRGTLNQRQAESRAANYARVSAEGGRRASPSARRHLPLHRRPLTTYHPPRPLTRPSRRRGRRWVAARQRCRAGRRWHGWRRANRRISCRRTGARRPR